MGRNMGIGKKNRCQVSGAKGQAADVQNYLPTASARHSSHVTRHCPFGFTLIELMVVITIILILATFAMPSYHVAVVHSREAVLRDDLFTMRKMIDEYTVDKQHPPSSLDELVEAGYLRGGVPVDPFTGSNQTWRTDIEDVPITPDQATSGIVDVHSGSEDNSLDGTAYSSW
jgi:general secretion pathway protein G